MGPVIADVARQISERQTDSPWTWSLVDPATGRVLDTGITRRRPTAAQKRRIRGRDRTCVFPGCRMPARNCDLDHNQPWARGGPTTVCNCVPLCRTHHRLKTHTPWRYRRLPTGDYEWTSPLGHTYPTSGRDP